MVDLFGPGSGALVLLALSALILVVLLILHGRKGQRPKMRPLPAFQGLRDEIERAAESGKPLHIALGSGGLNGEDTVTSLAGLQIVEALADAAVSYNIPPIITVGHPTLFPLAQDALRRAYDRQELTELYNPAQVRFVAPSPMAYAAGAAHVVAAEGVTASVTVGAFGSEVSLITDAGARRDVLQFAAAAAPQALGALYPTTDRLAVGEELYAIGAHTTGKRHYLASLVAQDVLRVILVLIIIVTAILEMTGGIQ